MADNKTKRFLKVISQIESSGGKNKNHRTIQEGMHAGMAGFGNYGLMPNTVNDVGRRLASLNKTDEDTAPLGSMPTEQVNPYLAQHPQAEEKVADFLGRNLLARMHGNEEMAGHAWHSGSNLTPEQITPEQLDKDPYVQKYRSIRNSKLLDRFSK